MDLDLVKCFPYVVRTDDSRHQLRCMLTRNWKVWTPEEIGGFFDEDRPLSCQLNGPVTFATRMLASTGEKRMDATAILEYLAPLKSGATNRTRVKRLDTESDETVLPDKDGHRLWAE